MPPVESSFVASVRKSNVTSRFLPPNFESINCVAGIAIRNSVPAAVIIVAMKRLQIVSPAIAVPRGFRDSPAKTKISASGSMQPAVRTAAIESSRPASPRPFVLGLPSGVTGRSSRPRGWHVRGKVRSRDHSTKTTTAAGYTRRRDDSPAASCGVFDDESASWFIDSPLTLQGRRGASAPLMHPNDHG